MRIPEGTSLHLLSNSSHVLLPQISWKVHAVNILNNLKILNFPRPSEMVTAEYYFFPFLSALMKSSISASFFLSSSFILLDFSSSLCCSLLSLCISSSRRRLASEKSNFSFLSSFVNSTLILFLLVLLQNQVNFESLLTHASLLFPRNSLRN